MNWLEQQQSRVIDNLGRVEIAQIADLKRAYVYWYDDCGATVMWTVWQVLDPHFWQKMMRKIACWASEGNDKMITYRPVERE